MSQDHKTGLLMVLVRWIDPVQSPLEQGQVLFFAWEQTQGGVGSIVVSVGGEPPRLSPIYHWGRACLLFYLQFLKLKMFLCQGIAPFFTFLLATSTFMLPFIIFWFVFQLISLYFVHHILLQYKWILTFVLQQSTRGWSLMVQKEWRDQWLSD